MRHPTETKIWGETRCLLFDRQFARFRLRCRAGGYSSFHYHLQRANRFRVIAGELWVWEVYGSQVTTHRLTDGQILEIPSLVVHAFGAAQHSTVIEDYWPDRGGSVLFEDIARLSVGGLVCGGRQRQWDSREDFLQALADTPVHWLRDTIGNQPRA